jgi:hypothetical protein
MIEINRDSVLAELSRHIGKARGISCADLVRAITWQTPGAASMRRVRKLIESLRREGEHVCGHPNSGYFIAANEAELNETCLFLHDRAMTTLTQVSAMKKASIPDLRGQLRLPG